MHINMIVKVLLWENFISPVLQVGDEINPGMEVLAGFFIVQQKIMTKRFPFGGG